MPVVFACIAPHAGHLLAAPPSITPVPESRAAMKRMRSALRNSRADTLAILTPHGVYAEEYVTVGVAETARGELDDRTINARTDVDLVAAWAYHGSSLGIPIAPAAPAEDVPFPLDWGVTIPLALLDPAGELPVAIACPGRAVPRKHLVAWGEALAHAANDLGRRVAVIISADQGHGHAKDGPYGFSPISAEYDRAMVKAVQADDLASLLDWKDDWIDAALPDSYWQTLALLGIRKHVSLSPCFLSYEVDHYFGLLCAMYESAIV